MGSPRANPGRESPYQLCPRSRPACRGLLCPSSRPWARPRPALSREQPRTSRPPPETPRNSQRPRPDTWEAQCYPNKASPPLLRGLLGSQCHPVETWKGAGLGAKGSDPGGHSPSPGRRTGHWPARFVPERSGCVRIQRLPQTASAHCAVTAAPVQARCSDTGHRGGAPCEVPGWRARHGGSGYEVEWFWGVHSSLLGQGSF